ncbi:MAG: thioredoxin domain-containing protein [Pseudomonadota bacterium]
MTHAPQTATEAAKRRLARPATAAAAAALIIGLAACGQDQSADAGGVDAATEAASAAVANAAEATVAATSADGAEETAEGAASADAALADKGYALGDVVLGSPDAPVTMIEYASLTCPACQAFHELTVPTLKKEYIETGKLKLIVRELHGARIGLDATAVARCGGADKYHAFLDLMFSRQENYLTQDRAANLEELRRIGKVGGLSAERIEQCLTDEAYLNELFRFSRENVEADEVPATPYLILQPGPDQQTIRGAVGPDELSDTIDALIEG